MTDEHQSLYDDYVAKYGKPKEVNHLIAFSKKVGKHIKFSQARKLINKNKNQPTKKNENKNENKNETNSLKNINVNSDSTLNAQNLKAKVNPLLNSVIKPLSSMEPKDISPKTPVNVLPFARSDGNADLQNYILYKTVKNGRFVKKKGTGTTPKGLIDEVDKVDKVDKAHKVQAHPAKNTDTINNRKEIFSNNPWLRNDTKKPKAPLPKKEINIPPKPKSPLRSRSAPSTPSPSPPSPSRPKLKRRLTPIPLKKPNFVIKPKADKPLPVSPPRPIKYAVKPKDYPRGSPPFTAPGLAQPKPLSNQRRIELKENADIPMHVGGVPVPGNKNEEKEEQKVIIPAPVNVNKEKQVLKWINKKMGKELLRINNINMTKSMLCNGQLLLKLINKLKPNLIDKRMMNKKVNEEEYDIQRIALFLDILNQHYDINSNHKTKNIFTVNDLLCISQKKNKKAWSAIINTLYLLKLKSETPETKDLLSLWCKHHNISSNIYLKLKENKYSLYQLILLKSDDIESLCASFKIKKQKIYFIKKILELKQQTQDTMVININEDNFYANLKTKQVFNIEKKNDTKKVLKYFIEFKNVKNILKISNRYIKQDWFVNYLLGFISRIHINKLKKINDVLPDYKPIVYSFYNDNDSKLSFNLMELITDDQDLMDAFITMHFDDIILHSLACYHKDSKGNAFHARIICDVLLNKYTDKLYKSILDNKTIQLLLKSAVFCCLDHGNLNSFILELLAFDTFRADIILLKKQVIAKFMDWKFIDYVLSVCSADNVFCVNYSYFVLDLVSRCAYDAASCQLFASHGNVLVDTFMSGLLNSKLSLFDRCLCAQTLSSIIDVLKIPNLIIDDDSNMNSDMPNHLHQLFESSITFIYNNYFDKLCEEIIHKKEKKKIRINNRVIHKPFGMIGLHCIELIGLTVDLSMLNASKPLGFLSLSFWDSLLDLTFVYADNNLFLNQFRRLIHLCMLFRRRILKHLCLQSNLLLRFIDFYLNNQPKTELHGYIVQMLWNFYYHDQQNQMTTNFSREEADQFDIIHHFESLDKWTKFLEIIENEMKSRVISQEMQINEEIEEEHEEIDEENKYKLSDSDDSDTDSDSDSDMDDMDGKDEEEAEIEEDPDDLQVNIDWTPFRRDIMNKNVMPNIAYLSDFGVFKDYNFNEEINTNNKCIPDENNLFYISYCSAHDVNGGYYVIFKYNINTAVIDREREINRKINLMIVLDHSLKMKYKFRQESKSKLKVSNDIILNIFTNILSDEDRFGLISYNHEAYLDFDLDFKGTYDAQQIAECLCNMGEYGGCDIEEAYNRAIDSFVSLQDMDGSNDEFEYENRILFITSKQPSSKDEFPETLLNVCQRYSIDAKINVLTTFISVSKPFESNIIDEIYEAKGCNYFHVGGEKDFLLLSDSFKDWTYPLVHDVNITISNEANQCVIENIFGGMMNDNERLYRCKTGIIKSFKTLFINSFDNNDNNNNVILIKIKEGIDINLNEIKILIQYQENNGKTQQFNCNVSLLSQLNPYYDNADIQRIVLLTGYVKLLKLWIMDNDDDDANDIYLRINDEYKEKFRELSMLFEADIALQKDLNIILKLANYDAESAQIIRNLAKYDTDNPHI